MPKAQDDDLVMNLVELTLSQPPGAREDYLRAACADDAELFSQVWDYVQWNHRMRDFLLDPLFPRLREHQFQPGDLLADRFRILHEVAQGGMGIVYEAEDEKLGRRIALKCAKSGFRQRLPPEVRHASEISHPHVCKIFEIHTASTQSGEIDFLTMEFLEGETLAARLSRGPLPEGEARTIGRQICAGLAEAHRNHVVHGDLKSSNVILTQDARGGVRAVITDFGLARKPLGRAEESRGGLAAGEAGSSQAGGTPDYMAPELWRGGKSSAASDVYALGVILYELAASHRPYAREIPWQDRPKHKPSAVRYGWDSILRRCLDPDPASRFSDAQELAQALEPSRNRLLWMSVAAAVVAAVIAGTVSYERATAPKELVTLAVLPFDTDASDRALGDGLLEGTVEQLRHVKGNPTQRLTVIPLADAVKNKVDNREKAMGLLGATHVLTGSLRRDGPRVQIHAYLADARSGLPLKERQAEYRVDELRALPVALAGLVTETLRLPPLAVVATVNGAAYADFVRGVGLLQLDKVDEALPFLENAARADPNSPLTHARLAEAQHRKYEFIKDIKGSGGDEWQQQAKASLARAELFNPDVALVRAVSGRINEYAGLYDEAKADYLRALELEPRNGDFRRRLGDLYEKMSRFHDAIAAYQEAVRVQPGYFKNHEALCSLYADQADFDGAIAECKEVIGLVPQLSEAHYSLAKPYVAAGRYFEGEQELRTAVGLDQMSSKALHALALALVSQGRYTEAISDFKSAATIGPETEILYLNLGTAYRLAGRKENAKEAYTRAVTLARDELSNTNYRDRMVRSHLAYLYARLHQTKDAEFEAQQVLQASNGSMEVARMIVETYAILGDWKRAVALAHDLPDEMLKRLNRSPDLADLPKDSRFTDLMQSHHIQ